MLAPQVHAVARNAHMARIDEANDDLCAAFATAPAAPGSPFAHGQQLFRQGDAVRLVYQLREGVVISYRLLSDGRRQVAGFQLPGDLVGLEAGTEYATTAEALSNVRASAIARGDLADRAGKDIDLARALWQATTHAFQQSERHAMILARHGATERVAAFLLDFSERLGHPELVELPMTRQDIADFLGLTIHTVSRTLSQLQAEGLIQARSTRHVRLLERGRLESICA
jgi:CRP/FNR family transcriptional regulator/CRP/FNR family nitrogen fixation transcriptional regulator